MKNRMTKTVVEGVKPGEKDTWIHDTETRGFCARITPEGQRLYYARYSRNGQRFTVPIGKHGTITCAKARARAEAIMAEVALGGHPAAARRTAMEALTLSEFADVYRQNHLKVHLKQSSQDTFEVFLSAYILPALGGKKLVDITPPDIEKMHAGLKETPVAANRAVSLLNSMLTLARRWGHVQGPNPCEGIRRFKEHPRKRYLAPAEVKKLAEVLTVLEKADIIPWQCAALFRLLLLTGARRGELLNLRWPDVDLQNEVLNLADSKTGPKQIRLNRAAAVILGKLQRHESEWVFPSPRRKGDHLDDPKRAWETVCGLAKITNCHVHDLRHTHAAFGVSAGLTLPVVGALLGHTQERTTQRYSHLQDDPLKAAANLIGDALSELMEGKAGAQVVEIGGAGGQTTETAQAEEGKQDAGGA
jgi:integrase